MLSLLYFRVAPVPSCRPCLFLSNLYLPVALYLFIAIPTPYFTPSSPADKAHTNHFEVTRYRNTTDKYA